MTESLQLTRPVMRRGACLNANQARREFPEEAKNPRAPQLLTHDHQAICVDAVNLKDRLGNVQTNRANFLV
jgi:hypothetical protein